MVLEKVEERIWHKPKSSEWGEPFFLNCPNLELVEAGIDPKPTHSVRALSSKYQDMWTDFLALVFYTQSFCLAPPLVPQYTDTLGIT